MFGNKKNSTLAVIFIAFLSSFVISGTNYCKEGTGKCTNCVKDLTDASTKRCARCYKSTITKDGACEKGISISNCISTGQSQMGLTFISSIAATNFKPVCAVCEEGYHTDILQGTCYNTAKIANCEYEFSASVNGVTAATCYGCKSGYKMVMSLTMENNQANKCEAGTTMENCRLNNSVGGCLGCKKGFILQELRARKEALMMKKSAF